jgi:hypothetical protein
MSNRPTLLVCTHRRMGANPACGRAGEKLAGALGRHLAERGLDWAVARTDCLGHCTDGPNLKAAPGGPILHGCRAERTAALVDRLLAEWKPGAREGWLTPPA